MLVHTIYESWVSSPSEFEADLDASQEVEWERGQECGSVYYRIFVRSTTAAAVKRLRKIIEAHVVK